MRVQVGVSEAGTHWNLIGGHPAGADALQSLVSSWPGWRRMPTRGQLLGSQPASLYTAACWPAQTLLLCRSSLEVEWTEQARARSKAILEHLEARDVVLRAGDADLRRTASVPWDVAPDPTHPLRQLLPHQAAAVRAIELQGGRALLADDMGLGKTATALVSWWRSEHRRLLVVAPKSLLHNWRNEASMFLGPPELIPAFVYAGTDKERANTRAAAEHLLRRGPLFLNAVDGRAILILNYDSLRVLNEQWKTLVEEWVAHQWLICDESHAVKSVTSERTKLTRALSERARGVVLLSGTPVRNTSEDLFSQLEIVRPGSWTSHNSFVDRYLVRVPMEIPQGPRKRTILVVRGQKNTHELSVVTNTMMIRRHRDTIEGLPPKIVTRPSIDLDDATRELYNGMKNKAVALIGDFLRIDDNAPIFEPRAKSALEAAMRCEQICQGFLGKVPDEYLEIIRPWIGNELVRIPGLDNSLALPSAPKLRWIIDLIEEIAVVRGERIAVISRFNAPLFYLQSLPEFAARTTMLVGSMSAIQREESVQAFQSAKKSVMLAQVALCEGWNAQACTDVIFLGRSWSPAANEQAEARFHRIGSKGTVNIQIPMCRGTIEERIDKRLSGKAEDAERAVKSLTLKELSDML